eukprot:TRINITY_DN10734_c0_g2_i1.p1 TRINITY_DN10734_c0_g2~~TRINITY_DN10734_c0_g2_i1.p1  ORF type:complete len:336 (-),score=62.21 TRINITY_DN10734_c0_g2_i1:154-1161(-)
MSDGTELCPPSETQDNLSSPACLNVNPQDFGLGGQATDSVVEESIDVVKTNADVADACGKTNIIGGVSTVGAPSTVVSNTVVTGDGGSGAAPLVVPTVTTPEDRKIQEDLLRAEKRARAQAELAEFNEQRRRETEERQRRNRERANASTAAATSGPASVASAGAATTATSSLPGVLTNLLADPAAVSAMQQLMGKMALGGGGDVGTTGVGGLPAGLAALLSSSAAPVAVPVATAAASPSAALAVRVREHGSERMAFRRVVLRAEGASEIGPPIFADVEARVCAKFKSSRGADGAELGPRRMIALVRLHDQLEICDDEEAALLVDGDELEVTLVAQ